MPSVVPGTGQMLRVHRPVCVLRAAILLEELPASLDLRQPEIQNLGVSALGHEDVRRLDVAVDDAF